MTALELHATLVAQAKQLAEMGLMVWTQIEPPKPDAMRAFEGRSDNGFLVLVQQGNTGTVEVPHVRHHAGGMYTGTLDGNPLVIVLHFTEDEADYLYHKAAVQRN